jgi:casein kinase I family protein HRR25
LLCKDLPLEFSRILEYIFSLDQSLDPDYTYIETLLKKAADSNGIVIDNIFNWYDNMEKKEKFEIEPK